MTAELDTTASPLVIGAGSDSCELLPWLGGSIGAWNVGDQQMLRRARIADVTRRNPFGMGAFPLVPFSNRIGDARFSWAGKSIRLQRNFLPEPHAIHGVGFERPWRIAASDRESAELVLEHAGDSSWPWPFEARQRIVIGAGTLSLELRATNRATIAVPLAFGHHPYFPKAGASLRFTASDVWLVGPEGLPTRAVRPSAEFDFSIPAPVTARSIDNCYIGWDGQAAIAWSHQPRWLEIRASRELPCAVVYVRDEETGFCFEPVPHLNNSLNLPSAAPAIPVIAPGDSYAATIRFHAIRK